jgi:hypothetical protein
MMRLERHVPSIRARRFDTSGHSWTFFRIFRKWNHQGTKDTKEDKYKGTTKAQRNEEGRRKKSQLAIIKDYGDSFLHWSFVLGHSSFLRSGCPQAANSVGCSDFGCPAFLAVFWAFLGGSHAVP